jgi:glucose/arabinose dehydrogenase
MKSEGKMMLNVDSGRARARFHQLLSLFGGLMLAAFLGGCAVVGDSAPASTPLAPTAQPTTSGPTQPASAALAEEATAAATAAVVGGPTEPAAPAASPTAAATESPAASPAAQSTPTAAASAQVPGPVRLDAVKLALEPVAGGFSNPLYVTNAKDGSNRLFVVEKTGTIRTLSAVNLLPQPFLDISDRIRSSGSEQGLLGLAFPPDYATRKYFFVNYTDRAGDTIVARYNVTGDPNIADPATEFVVLKLDQPAPNHNGGDLAFGPDGFLWIGTGDGGAANDRFNNGQNPDTLLAKMLRLDVTSDPSRPYVVPQDNPWVAQQWNGRQVRPEVWAVGLRNPWRYSFDRATGDLWIADVGQNEIEEVNVTRAPLKGGLNFGWPIQEGRNCFRDAKCDPTGLVQPVAQYTHGADGCSVTGGFVYRGQQFPALAGAYLYGDYCSGRLWGLDAANPGAPVLMAEAGPGLSSFGEDEAGELYVTDLAGGTVRRITVR